MNSLKSGTDDFITSCWIFTCYVWGNTCSMDAMCMYTVWLHLYNTQLIVKVYTLPKCKQIMSSTDKMLASILNVTAYIHKLQEWWFFCVVYYQYVRVYVCWTDDHRIIVQSIIMPESKTTWINILEPSSEIAHLYKAYHATYTEILVELISQCDNSTRHSESICGT